MNQQEKLYPVLVKADKIRSYIFQTGKLTDAFADSVENYYSTSLKTHIKKQLSSAQL